jgi:DNA-binding response OmpR family regulator
MFGAFCWSTTRRLFVEWSKHCCGQSASSKLKSLTTAPRTGTVASVQIRDHHLRDWEMEPINGLEVLRQVRGRQETKSVPFVLMSARKDPQWVSAAMEAGADCLIAKPFGAATLKAKIHQIGRAGRSGGIRERVLA